MDKVKKNQRRVTFQLRIEPELKALIASVAKSRGLDASSYVRMVVIDRMRQDGTLE